MAKQEGIGSPLFEEIWNQTLLHLKDSKVFDKAVLDKLESLAESGDLKDEKKVLGAIQPKAGDSNEDSGA